MSKFDEMCDAAIESRRMWSEFRNWAYRELVTLVNGFVAHCEIPSDNISFLPLDKEPEERKKYAIPGATHYDKDGFWHLGLCLNLSRPKPGATVFQQLVLIEICVTRKEGKMTVRLGREGRPRELDLTNQNQRKDFYDEIVGQVKHVYEAATAEAIQNQTMVKIGFHS